MHTHVTFTTSSDISGYDFKTLGNTDCSPRGEWVETLTEAENVCKNDKNCNGILDIDCNGNNNYYICPKNATTLSDKSIESCVYEKYIIGKQ